MTSGLSAGGVVRRDAAADQRDDLDRVAGGQRGARRGARPGTTSPIDLDGDAAAVVAELARAVPATVSGSRQRARLRR